MATIRKHRNKWQVQVRRSGFAPQSRTFDYKSDAEAWARKTERQFDSGDVGVNHHALRRVSVEDLLKRYRSTVTPKKRGAHMERYKIDTLLRHPIAHASLLALSSALVANYRDERLRTVAPATVRRELSVLHHCLDVARKDWGVPLAANPVDQITLPKLPQSRDRRPTSGEIDRLLKGCSKGRTKLFAPIIRFAIETGMRRGEIVAMRWEDIDFDAQTLHIPVTKTGVARDIPLSDAAVAIIRDLPCDTQRVFPISTNALRLAWERLKRREGIEDLHCRCCGVPLTGIYNCVIWRGRGRWLPHALPYPAFVGVAEVPCGLYAPSGRHEAPPELKPWRQMDIRQCSGLRGGGGSGSGSMHPWQTTSETPFLSNLKMLSDL